MTPSASHIIICSRSLSLKIYALHSADDDFSLLTVSLIKTVKPHSTPVVTSAIDSTGSLLATGAADGGVKVWDIRGGYSTHTFGGHTGVISALCFFHAAISTPSKAGSDKGQTRAKSGPAQDSTVGTSQKTTATLRLASGSEDGKIRVWNLAKRKSIAILDSHVSVVRSLDFSERAGVLVSASRDKTAIIWDAKTWTSKKVIPILESLKGASIFDRKDLFFTGGEHGRLRIWDTGNGAEVTREQTALDESDSIVHMLFCPRKNIIITVHANQVLVLHSTSSIGTESVPGKQIAPLPILRRISGTHDEIIDLAYVMPDHSLLALATNSEEIRLVSLATSSPETDSLANADYFGADVASLQGHSDIIICLTVDPSGHWLATGAKDNTARLWRIDRSTNNYEHYTTFTGHAESIGAVVLPHFVAGGTSSTSNKPLDNPPPFSTHRVSRSHHQTMDHTPYGFSAESALHPQSS